MDGGYINEGGQLKTKNGQKYVINDRPEGIFISKFCAILTAVIVALMMIIIILITYFLTIGSRIESCPVIDVSNRTITTAGMYGLSSTNGHSSSTIENGDSKNKTIEDSNKNSAILADEGTKTTSKDIKLHDGWSPISYRLTIEPNISSSQSVGSVLITVVKDDHTKELPPIVLDINNITIHKVIVVDTARDEEELNFTADYGSENDSYYIKLSERSIKNTNNLTLALYIEFTSQLTSTLQGFYKTSYTDKETGEIKWVTSTQFSPIDARRAFPCFDRPDKKATFDISLVRKEDTMMTLSNMPSVQTVLDHPGYVREDFNTTPKMSTYLVAFIVSDLVRSNHTEEDELIWPEVNIWTRPDTTTMTRYAFELTRKILPYFEEYFNIPFALPKIDLVAVPDFGFGAMENWGLIIFRDSALLVPEGEEQSSSAAHHENVASILSHELAHQWFGNLVTPKWWNDLWLKEGFATYMSYLAVDHVKPSWDVISTFPITAFQGAMEEDSSNSAHPISFAVSSNIDIRRIFDPISYSKGAIVIRMMNSFLGDEAFIGAIRKYLKDFSYRNADQDDLWKLMTRFGHKHGTLPLDFNIKEIMDSWTIQPGYPVITVKRLGKDIVVSQHRYSLPQKNVNDESKWFIPITFETSIENNKTEIPTHWLTNKVQDTIIADVFPNANNSNEWIYLNIKRTGYYRVNYDKNSWIVLKRRIRELPALTRAQLLDDSLHLAQSELLSYDIPLTFLLELPNKVEDHLFWRAASNGLTYLTHMLVREPAFETFRGFMKHMVRSAYDHYGIVEHDNSSHIELMQQARVVRYACYFNYDRCTNAAHLKYREWMRTPTKNLIKPNLKETIYCTALREGSFQEWYFAYDRYLLSKSASEKEQILSSMGCTMKPWLLSKYLNMTIDPSSGIRKQDGARAFAAVARNFIGYEIAFDFLVTNIKEISEYFGDGFSTLSKMVHSVTTFMNKEYQKDQLDKFAIKARSLGLKNVETAIELASVQVKNNIYWRSRSYYNLKNFLEAINKKFGITVF